MKTIAKATMAILETIFQALDKLQDNCKSTTTWEAAEVLIDLVEDAQEALIDIYGEDIDCF